MQSHVKEKIKFGQIAWVIHLKTMANLRIIDLMTLNVTKSRMILKLAVSIMACSMGKLLKSLMMGLLEKVHGLTADFKGKQQ